MIVTTLAHLEDQVVMTPALQAACKFLQNLDPGTLQDGRFTIDGDRVFAIISSYTPKKVESQVEMEGHRRYIDLQYLVHGDEEIGWAPTEQVKEIVSYQSESDAWQGELPSDAVTWVRLTSGQLAVLYPSDAHAPQHAFGSPKPVRKIVVKVIVE